MKYKKQPYNIEQQVFGMKKLYPQFKVFNKTKYSVSFVGELKVADEFQKYKISINFRGNDHPIAKVLSPKLVDNPPHYYKDPGCLCLYHPRLFKWKREKLISKEIIPLIATWIYFYEVWLQTGKWYGPEAPHDLNELKKLEQ